MTPRRHGGTGVLPVRLSERARLLPMNLKLTRRINSQQRKAPSPPARTPPAPQGPLPAGRGGEPTQAGLALLLPRFQPPGTGARFMKHPSRRLAGQISQGEPTNAFQFESNESCAVRAEALEARSSHLELLVLEPTNRVGKMGAPRLPWRGRKSPRRYAATPFVNFVKGGEQAPPWSKGAASEVSGGFAPPRTGACSRVHRQNLRLGALVRSCNRVSS
jgi:hypothetical protein